MATMESEQHNGQGLQAAGGTTRRAFVAGAGAGAAALALVACGGSNSDAGPGYDDSVANAKVPSGKVLAKTSDVPVEGALAVTVSGKKILITQPAKGTFKAFSAVCTHAGCVVSPAAGELKCPCHNWRFDLSTAKVLKGDPGSQPLPEIKVSVSGDQVLSA